MGLPSWALIPSTPHMTQEWGHIQRCEWHKGTDSESVAEREQKSCALTSSPSSLHTTPENLPFLSTMRRVAMFVCLLGHLRLDHLGERMSWCSAFNLFLFLPLEIKVLLISHNLIYVLYLLFLNAAKVRYSKLPSSILSSHTILSPGMSLSTTAVAQNLCMFREYCFHL